MARPSSLPEWASSPTAGDVTDPGTARKASGWKLVGGIPEKPSYQTFNWYQQNVFRWIEYLSDLTDAEFTQLKNIDAVTFSNAQWSQLSALSAGTGTLLTASGTALAPAVASLTDPDTGWFHPVANALGLSLGGVEQFRFTGSQFQRMGGTGVTTSIDVEFPLLTTESANYQMFRFTNTSGNSTSLTIFKATNTGDIQHRLFVKDGQTSYIANGTNSKLAIGKTLASERLDVDGNIAASGVLKAGAGSATDPSMTRSDDTDTGWFFPALNTMGLTLGGSEHYRFTSGGGIQRRNGNAISFMDFDFPELSSEQGTIRLYRATNTSSINLGFYLHKGDASASLQHAFFAKDAQTSYFANGTGSKVAIGKTSAVARLDVDGDTHSSSSIRSGSGTAATPGLSFIAATNKGFFDAALNRVGLAISGQDAFWFGPTSMERKGGANNTQWDNDFPDVTTQWCQYRIFRQTNTTSTLTRFTIAKADGGLNAQHEFYAKDGQISALCTGTNSRLAIGKTAFTDNTNRMEIDGGLRVEGNLQVTGSMAGAIPLGGVVATFPYLTPAYNCTATTAADAAGYVQCNGQQISDATSTFNTFFIPNLNDDVFIMGHVTSGTAGGANTKTIAETNLPSHSHNIQHNHDMTHIHQVAHRNSTNNTVYFNTGTSATNATWSGTGGNTLISTGDFQNGTTAGWTRAVITDQATTSNFFTSRSLSAGPSTAKDVTGAPATLAGTFNSGTTGGGTALDIRPKYITAKYIMRIK